MTYNATTGLTVNDLLPRQENLSDPKCVTCDYVVPDCSSCGDLTKWGCNWTSRTCSACPAPQCFKLDGGGSSVNPGIIAGPIIGAALIIGAAITFWYLRRKKRRDLARLEDLAQRARKGESSAFHLSQPTSPVSASWRKSSRGVSLQPSPKSGTDNRGSRGSRGQTLPAASPQAEYRDENGATIRVYAGKRGMINADPNHPDNGGPGDPFGDERSMSTGQASSGHSGHSTNVIPIHFVPGQSNNGDPANTQSQAAAARTLDQARQNLWQPRTGPMPPQRPARSPDLDLRLNATRQPLAIAELASLGGGSRDSMHSDFSVAPSFLSGQTGDLHMDVPKIITRQQVHVGRLQAAEVVQFGGRAEVVQFNGQPIEQERNTGSPGSDPFSDGRSSESSTAPHSGGPAGRNTASMGSQRFDDDGNAPAQPSPTDLRFSMGSLAYDRASISTTGTGRRHHLSAVEEQPPVPAIPSAFERPRIQSTQSYQSTGGDSLLGSFPMIPPAAGGAARGMSTSSLDPNRGPPVAFKGTSNAGGRPLTANSAHSGQSIADSFLGSFPFLPPNVDAAHGSADAIRGSQQASTSRLTLGSRASEGLGDFDFSFDQSPSTDSVAAEEDPTTPRAPTNRRQ